MEIQFALATQCGTTPNAVHVNHMKIIYMNQHLRVLFRYNAGLVNNSAGGLFPAFHMNVLYTKFTNLSTPTGLTDLYFCPIISWH